MLQDPDIIDMMLEPGLGITMLMIMDTYPWQNPDSDERFQLFQAKLDAYCRYVASAQFDQDHPGAKRTQVYISFIDIPSPASARMKAITRVYTPTDPSYEIVVSFGDENSKLQTSTPPAKKPWWQFWG